MEDLNVQRSVSSEENTTEKMPTSEGNNYSVKENTESKTESNSIEAKSETTTEKTNDTPSTEEQKEEHPHSPQNDDSSARPKRDRKPSSLLQDFDSGDSLVGGRKSKVSPSSISPPQSPIPLSQRRKKTSSTDSTTDIEPTGEQTTNEQVASELVKLGSTPKEEENPITEASEEHKKTEGSSEIGSPMRIDEPTENESDSKKRSLEESPTDGDRAPKKIRLKYDENAHLQKIEKELKEERQKRKTVEDENQNLKQEVKSLRKQIAELSKTAQGGSTTVPIIQGYDTYITDERLRKAHQALISIMKHKFAYVFNEPVDPGKLALPDYFSIIKTPMDFGLIKRKLEGLAYSNLDDFVVDMNLVFSNAKNYNGPGTDVWSMADTLEKMFEKKLPGIKTSNSQTPAPTTPLPAVPSTPPSMSFSTPTPTTPIAPSTPAASEEVAMLIKQMQEMQVRFLGRFFFHFPTFLISSSSRRT